MISCVSAHTKTRGLRMRGAVHVVLRLSVVCGDAVWRGVDRFGDAVLEPQAQEVVTPSDPHAVRRRPLPLDDHFSRFTVVSTWIVVFNHIALGGLHGSGYRIRWA